MELRSGYLTPVEAKDWQGTLNGSEGSGSDFNPTPKLKQVRKEREQQQTRNAGSSPTGVHHVPQTAAFPTFPSITSWYPFQVTKLPRFAPLMARLTQDTKAKVEDGDAMGGLDPYYLDQYGGEHLPSPPARCVQAPIDFGVQEPPT